MSYVEYDPPEQDEDLDNEAEQQGEDESSDDE